MSSVYFIVSVKYDYLVLYSWVKSIHVAVVDMFQLYLSIYIHSYIDSVRRLTLTSVYPDRCNWSHCCWLYDYNATLRVINILRGHLLHTLLCIQSDTCCVIIHVLSELVARLPTWWVNSQCHCLCVTSAQTWQSFYFTYILSKTS